MRVAFGAIAEYTLAVLIERLRQELRGEMGKLEDRLRRGIR